MRARASVAVTIRRLQIWYATIAVGVGMDAPPGAAAAGAPPASLKTRARPSPIRGMVPVTFPKCYRRRMSKGSDYCIKPGYRSRLENEHHDDTGFRDEWQREVYVYAAELMQRERLALVIDIGCGSGFKLVSLLGEFETIGVEVPPAYDLLRSTYPERTWFHWTEMPKPGMCADLVMASDVIEHFPDPGDLIAMIQAIPSRYVVLSTPERDLIRGKSDFGPPENRAHCREWNSDELRRYASLHFDVIDHAITNREQGTQLVLCRPR